MSKSERVLWNLLRRQELGFKFRRQYPLGPYVLDFYCPIAQLCVEVDGPLHAGRQSKDLIRDQYLKDFGIQTIRIPTGEFFDHDAPGVYEWAERIKAICIERTAS